MECRVTTGVCIIRRRCIIVRNGRARCRDGECGGVWVRSVPNQTPYCLFVQSIYCLPTMRMNIVKLTSSLFTIKHVCCPTNAGHMGACSGCRNYTNSFTPQICLKIHTIVENRFLLENGRFPWAGNAAELLTFVLRSARAFWDLDLVLVLDLNAV
jgi:hypothetical protein